MPPNELDGATTAACEGQAISAMWRYTLDTSNDDDYPFISHGQLLLREDGVVFQRVELSEVEYDKWRRSARAYRSEAYTVADVEQTFSSSKTNYTIVRTI
jgi:hypothetical protein